MELCARTPTNTALASARPPLSESLLAAARAESGDRPARIIVAMAQCFGTAPVSAIHAGKSGGPCAAIWRLVGPRLSMGAFPYCVLSYRRDGTSAVTKIANKRRTHRRPKIGSATFVPDDTPVEWLLDGPCSAVQVYIAPQAVQCYAEECLGTAATPRIADFFAIEDPWLAGYFQLLISEYETFRLGEHPPDGLLLEQTQHFLVRHLVRWHADTATTARAEFDERRTINPLQPFLARRIHDFIEVNMARDISLQVLANLAAMSSGHFLRAFKASTGKTPYRYLLERRLSTASQRLRTTAVPIALVARECGFRTPSHFTTAFHAHFGMSPMRYRAGARERI
jgi:AraC family transcriptional regulator